MTDELPLECISSPEHILVHVSSALNSLKDGDLEQVKHDLEIIKLMAQELEG